MMGRIRLCCAEQLELANAMPPRSQANYKFIWVLDFPMFLPNESTCQLESVHHPFTAPHKDDADRLTADAKVETLTKIRSQAYDLVLNGWEVGGGSIRIHRAAEQRMVLDDILRIDHSHMSHLIDALDSGCPPHGGIALGLDRLLSILCDAPSIRDVIAFPKSADGKDLLSKAPVPITAAELEMYNIKVVVEDDDILTKKRTSEEEEGVETNKKEEI